MEEKELTKAQKRKQANIARGASNMRRQQIAKQERQKAKQREAKLVASQSPEDRAKKEALVAQQEAKRQQENRVWKQKREDRYQQKVWRGWRTSEPASKVVKYNLNDITETNTE